MHSSKQSDQFVYLSIHLLVEFVFHIYKQLVILKDISPVSKNMIFTQNTSAMSCQN